MSIRGTKSARRVHARRPARGSGRIESADARRERIVRMAAPLFLKHGYDNVSIDDIIEVVGGSKATVYAWFGGKEGLFEAVVRQECQDVTMAIHVDATGSLEAQLTEIGHSFLARVLSPEILEFHRLMVSIGRKFPEVGRLFFRDRAGVGLQHCGDLDRSSSERVVSSKRIRIGLLCCFSTC
jgi:Transcriptional regulator